MKIRNFLLISIIFIFLIVVILIGIINYGINKEAYYESEPYHCYYSISVTGLSNKEVNGTTMIMTPIPASKEGKFFTPHKRKHDFMQWLYYELHQVPEKDREYGPHLRNMTETFDSRYMAQGKWVNFIAETEKGPMLCFRTNETWLEDINFGASFVADHSDIFDPINNGSSILFPIENISNTSSVPYGDYTKYATNPTYDTYVYLSNNLKGGENISFELFLEALNDPTVPEKYFGQYNNIVFARVNDTGFVKVQAILAQTVPYVNSTGEINSSGALDSQYAHDYWDNKTSHVVNGTSRRTG